MDDHKKESAGLFRLDDLESIEVSDNPVFAKKKGEASPAALATQASADQMVDLIRKARSAQSDGHSLDEISDAPQPSIIAEAPEPAVPQAPTVVAKSSSATDMASVFSSTQGNRKAFSTSEMRAVLAAAENEIKRQGRFKYILMFGILTPIILGLIGLVTFLLVTMPPSMLEGSYPVSVPTLVSGHSELAMIQIEMIPEPEPVIEQPVSPPETDHRPRERNRQRRERDRVDTSNLF